MAAGSPFHKLLVANRSEIAIRVFRSAHELGIRTVALYSHEDRFALHRFKADEAYEVGQPGEPIRSYLNIPAIVALAKERGVDAVHPGYGFLSENADFAQACGDAGIRFVGPKPAILRQLGDKVAARKLAQSANVPVLGGTDAPVNGAADAAQLADKLGYPVMVKASMGGGGRGMRVVKTADELKAAVEAAQREAGAAFGVSDVFLERYVQRARHIEVQLIGDQHGNLVHLFERDCSLQRRHQKIVEIAPSSHLPPKTRQGLLDAALAIGKAVGLDNAGTVEFLVDADSGDYYFIEVNPRIQVEHTVTEQVTGHDIVRSQILVAQGRPLSDDDIGLGDQSQITVRGYAIQCRVTTEDPANGFTPDYGRLAHYRSASGVGIRLDAGTAFSGAVITPFYDSLLVKVTAQGLRFTDAARRMERCLQEFRIRGVKTNIPFLLNLIVHPDFLDNKLTTRFLDETPGLFQLPRRRDRATKLLTFIADRIVNGAPPTPGSFRGDAPVPPLPSGDIPEGTRTRLLQLGPEKFAAWIREQPQLLITDTTMRDAHQSLLATRMRTRDLLNIAPIYARSHAGLFSLENWGGATFDTSYRFLKESPWERLAELRQAIPNVLFQMLLRAASAVGYTNYPDNVVQAFVKEAANAGMDVFRIFDALNYLPNLRLAIDAVRATDKIAEAAICYTGDILDPSRTKYTLNYYVDLAKQLEAAGAHILAIKDMAGVLKPYAARALVKALREAVGLPIHLHTHDTAGGQLATLLAASEEGVDIVDCAFSALSGMTAQVSLNALQEALRFTPRDPGFDFDRLEATSEYWEAVRHYYAAFESGNLAASAEVYRHEMPGGQYTNLFQQADAVGLGGRWRDVRQMYTQVNAMFGDVIKVTPSSKVVGDMALFMVANNLAPNDVLNGDRDLGFPESVIEFFEGKLGQPPGGFPPKLQKRILGNRKPLTERPGATLKPADFDAEAKAMAEKYGRAVVPHEVVSSLLYPKVYAQYAEHYRRYSDVSKLPTPIFFTGMTPGEEVSFAIEEGKTLILKFLTVGDANERGDRLVFFELNGQPREVLVTDTKLAKASGAARAKATPGDPLQVGSPMPGAVVAVAVGVGDSVAAGQKLATLEAMKMETTITAEKAGRVAELLCRPGQQVEAGDLLMRLEG